MDIVHAHKSFWSLNNYPYLRLVEIPDEELGRITARLSRSDIIEWLMWNDSNGVYSDEASLREFGEVMSKGEGLEILLRQVKENKVVKNLKIV